MAICEVPSISYADWGERLKKRLNSRLPLRGTLEITPRCNNRCVHCYITHCPVDPDKKELSYKEYCHLLDQIAEAGCLWLLMTGGEPLVHRDFLDIYTYAKKKGFIVNLFTNGTLITPEIADYLHHWRPKSVEITLYGATRETYERVTGAPGSFERCTRGIELLVERHVPLSLKTVIMTINQHELPQMKEYARRLGVRFRYDAVMWPRLDGGKEPYDARLTPEEIVRLEQQDEAVLQAWREWAKTGIFTKDSPFLYTCNAGKRGFFVDPFGQLSLCISARQPSYDLRQGTFADAWERFLPEVKRIRCTKDYPCRHCDLLNICGSCPPIAEMDTGDPESAVPFLCRLAHLRVEAYGLRDFQSQGAPQTSLSAPDRFG